MKMFASGNYGRLAMNSDTFTGFALRVWRSWFFPVSFAVKIYHMDSMRSPSACDIFQSISCGVMLPSVTAEITAT